MDPETKQALRKKLEETGNKLYSIRIDNGPFSIFAGYFRTREECKAEYIKLYTDMHGNPPTDADASRYDDFTEALLDESSNE